VKLTLGAAVVLAGSLAALPTARAGGGLGQLDAMSVPRAAHAAARLSSGDVLITGGCVDAGCETVTASAEIFDAGRRKFVSTASMSRPRVGHAAVSLRDGTILVLGGWTGSRLTATAEVFLPARRRFVAVRHMSTAREGFTATRLRDGRVLVVGGRDGTRTLRSAEVYDPRTRTFRPAGRLGVARSAHAATLLADGRVLVVGGSNEGGVLASTEAWDPRTRSFSASGSMTVPRHKHAAVTLHDGSVLVVGGSDDRDFHGRYASAELFAAGRFRATGEMAEKRFKLPDAVVVLRSGDVLVAGGGPRVERYNAPAGTFGGRLPLTTALSFSTATLLPGGFVLVAGGYDEDIRPTAAAWFYGLP
jgi:hypothetical protein